MVADSPRHDRFGTAESPPQGCSVSGAVRRGADVNSPPSAARGRSPRRREGRRVTQGVVDQMAELRRQGLTFADIGARVGRSEKTARRYVGHVEPRIQLPNAQQDLDVEDPRELRAGLGKRFSSILHGGWDRWPSAAFLAESNRQLEERLAQTDLQTLRVLAQDPKVRSQFFLEVVGPLYKDFASCQNVHQMIQEVSFRNQPFLWRPPHERQSLTDDSEVVE